MDSRKLSKFQRVLQIPHLPATYVTHSELAAIAYEVRVEVKLGGLNKNPVVQIPVVIGELVGGPQQQQQEMHNYNISNNSSSLGFDQMMMSPGAQRMLNMSQLSSMSGSTTTTMSPGSMSLLETSSSSAAAASAVALAMEQASAPPAYHDVVPSKH